MVLHVTILRLVCYVQSKRGGILLISYNYEHHFHSRSRNGIKTLGDKRSEEYVTFEVPQTGTDTGEVFPNELTRNCCPERRTAENHRNAECLGAHDTSRTIHCDTC
jgi:hypothetical protein